MKLFDIAKKIGLGLIREAVPGGGLLLAAVNEFLPDDKKLPADATGCQVLSAVESLPPAERASLLEKEFDVDITQIKESNETLRVMLQADAASTHTTRPYIAKGAFRLVATISLVVIALWAYAVGTGNVAMVREVMDGWAFVAAVTAPFVTLLWAYFGILKQEHQNRLNGGRGGSTPSGLGGIISAVLGKR